MVGRVIFLFVLLLAASHHCECFSDKNSRSEHVSYCVSILSVIQFLVGCIFAYSSTLLAQLRQPSSTIKLNTDNESWITSVPILVCPVGLIIFGILSDKCGRVITLKIAYIPMILGWAILAIADSCTKIIISRIILGLPLGICNCLFLYVSEMCPAEDRSVYTSTIPVAVGVGMMIECAMSFYFQWRTLAGIMAVVGVVNFCTFFTLPESSMWLRSKGRADEADAVDEWFESSRATVAAAAVGPTAAVEPSRTADDRTAPEPYWSLYASRAVWRPALIVLAFFLLQQCTGVYVMLFYSMDAIRECKVSSDVNVAAVFLSAARVSGSVCFVMLHMLNRRTIVIVSGGGMAVSLITVVAYMKTFRDVQDPPFSILPIVALVAFMFFSLLGILPMPWILSSIVFPMAVKGVMSGAMQTFGYILWFAICKIYPSLLSTFGVETIWLMFSAFCILNVLFAIFIMPETQGKSLDEILSSMSTSAHEKTKNLNVL